MAGNNIEIQYLVGDTDILAGDIASMWTSWKAGKAVAEKDSAEVISYVFATTTKSLAQGSDWNHSTHLPKITSIYDTLKANYVEGLMPNRRWTRIDGEDDKSFRREFQRRIEGFIRTKHRVRGFETRVAELIDDWILYGNCFGEVSYVVEKAINVVTGVEEVVYEGPELRRISPNDIVFNPLAVDFASTPKIVRTIKTLGDIRKELDNGELDPDQWDLAALEELLARRSLLSGYAEEDINKSVALSIDGYGTAAQYLQGTTVEFLDLYGDIYDRESGTLLTNRVVTVVDRCHVVRNTDIPTWNGRPMIFHSSWRKRVDNLWGQGPLDNLVGMQYRINHLENARADMFDEMLSGDLVFLGDIEILQGENNQKIYQGPEGGAVRRLVPDTAVLNADFQIQALEAKMEFYAGTPKEASGFRTPGEKTKFEVSALMTGGAKLFVHKLGDFEREILGPILNAEIEVSARNLKGKDLIRLDDEKSGVKEIAEVTRDDLNFNGKVIPIGSRYFARQAQLAQELRVFQEVLATDKEMANHFPPERLALMWEEVMNIERFDLYEAFGRIKESAEAQQTLAAAQEVAGGNAAPQDVRIPQ